MLPAHRPLTVSCRSIGLDVSRSQRLHPQFQPDAAANPRIRSVTSEIGSKAKIPNPMLKPLQRFIGEWQTTGTHPFFPDTTVHGRSSFEWQDGGAFIVWRSQIDDDARFPNGIAIFGSDDEAGTIFVSYFDERGISRKYDVTVETDGFIMQRTDPKFSQRMTYRMEAGDNRIVSKGEMSRDGGAWEADLSTVYERQ
jgi:hypothetical protein